MQREKKKKKALEISTILHENSTVLAFPTKPVVQVSYKLYVDVCCRYLIFPNLVASIKLQNTCC